MRGERVLIVDDIGTTGGSLAKVIKQCQDAGAIVVGCQIMLDRSGGRITAERLGVERYGYLAKLDIVSYAENKCPACEKKVPIDVACGHGEAYLKEHPEKAAWGR